MGQTYDIPTSLVGLCGDDITCGMTNEYLA